MASPSGASTGSSCLLNKSGSEEELQALMDQKKRKRMLLNRESARRCRVRKQKRLEELATQVGQLRMENSQLLDNHHFITNQHLLVEAENSVLRAQIIELNSRLSSLVGILQYMNMNSSAGDSQMYYY
ncbi:hypothetical protein HPP92_021187 [Vanilla planifolia]|uniref:BZIP domain-containing protein n=1 Tax=Vanilla planifolia TaxID=51239 RepID=A0A835PY88_VANPL|nr:hypothetical protein HPP92_021187 [Vanilla planifolia]